MPTLFMGHMSGVNWIPDWAQGGSAGDDRFRVVSRGAVAGTRLRNWYTDRTVLAAQVALASELSRACAGHPASARSRQRKPNRVIPRQGARAKLAVAHDGRAAPDGGARVTVGLHMEDLEHDRNLGPQKRQSAIFDDARISRLRSLARSPTDEQIRLSSPALRAGSAAVRGAVLRIGVHQPGRGGDGCQVRRPLCSAHCPSAAAPAPCCGATALRVGHLAAPAADPPSTSARSGCGERTSPCPRLPVVEELPRSAPKRTPDAPKDSARIDIDPSEPTSRRERSCRAVRTLMRRAGQAALSRASSSSTGSMAIRALTSETL
jgi:hypothetical protein